MSENLYYGQFKQDKFVDDHFFKGKKNGVFLDIGASDGVSGSNTYYFEKQKGWKGVCFEPLPGIFDELAKNRKCICIQGCAASKPGKAQFLTIKSDSSIHMLSGLVSSFSSDHLSKIDKEVSRHKSDQEVVEVECFRVNDILARNQLNEVDFCSIDTEGSELEILKSIDHDQYHIKVFCVENEYRNKELENFMKSKNYTYISSLGVDQVFAHDSIIKDLPPMKLRLLRLYGFMNTSVRKSKYMTRELLIKAKVMSPQ